jgi:ATP-dependent DNA helicase RecG
MGSALQHRGRSTSPTTEYLALDVPERAARTKHGPYQLPAPVFRAGFRRTEAILYGPKPFEEMDREARVRACYQHCALQYVLHRQMTNQSLRERFKLPERKSAAVTRVIAATVEHGLVKLDEEAGTSRKHARYRPGWA